MLVAYLDDSGTDPQNPITLIGGYAASGRAWAAFEVAAEPIFQRYIGDIPLHATDLYHGEGIYEGWSVIKKQSFVAQLCLKLYPQKPLLGISFAVRKASYSRRAIEAVKRGFRKRTNTPHTFCMVGILNRILSDVEVGKMANEEGLTLILEKGNKNNEEARISLENIKELHGLNYVKSLVAVSKGECRAIQMADLFAFYTRRHNRKIETPGKEPPTDPVLQVLVEKLRHYSFVATDFGPEIAASRFLAGDP